MRSIFENIFRTLRDGKRRAHGLRLLAATLTLVLSGCAGGGVRHTSLSFNTVVIDAGHGGHDMGTRSGRIIMEKAAALDTAQRLERKLRGAGLRTVMTRTGDYFVELDQRVAISNRTGNAIFISVHFNESRPKPYVHGCETYYFSGVSADLARNILAKVSALPGSAPRFSKTARFRVLRNNRNPAVLVECGYMSNRAEAARCATPGYREKIADAIARAILEQRRP